MAIKKKRRVPWGWIWVLVIALAGGGYAFFQQQQAAKQARELPKGVQVGTAARGSIDQKINASGVVAAQTGAKVNIGSEIAGRVRSLPADVGTLVRAGQVVAEIYSPDLEAQLEQQRRNVDGARANVDQAQSRLSQALLNAGLVVEQNKAQIQEAEFAVRAARERLRVAEASSKFQPTQTATGIEQAEASLSTAKAQEAQTKATVALQIRQAQSDIDDAKAQVENTTLQLRRQRALLTEGFISRQQVDNMETDYRRASARLAAANASMNIVREKTQADLQTARNRVLEVEAGLRAAKAGDLQNELREAERRNAVEAIRQAEANLRLRRANRTNDVIQRQAVQQSRAALTQARATLKQAEAQLKFQQVQVDRTIIRSPINGTVTTINTQQGEAVAAGFQVQTLISITDLNRLEVRAFVDEVDIARVRLGLPVEVRVDALPERVFNGRVKRIAAGSTVKDNVVTYETLISVENPGGLLRPDMTADVTLILGRRPDVLLVPSEAIHRSIKQSYVYVLHREKKGKERVEKRTVTVGVDDGSQAEVKSGLTEGEEVILAGLPRLGVEAADAQRQGGPKKDEE